MGAEVTFYDLPVVEVELPGHLHIGIPGEDGATFTPSVSEDGILSWENDKNLENPQDTDLKILLEMAAEADLEQIRQDIEDLKYKPIEITAIGNNVGTAEMGSAVTKALVTWNTSKVPVTMAIQGELAGEPEEGVTAYRWLDNERITADKTYTVTVTDERGASAKASTYVEFLNGIYYGVLDYGTEITSEVILGLTKRLQSGRAVDFSVREKRPTYACPSRYGKPTFQIGGFAYDWEKVSTYDFTNASGYTESYDVWMHGQDAAGIMTIHVT